MTDRDKLKIWNMQSYPSTQRKSWAGRFVLGLSIAAVIALWSAVALADTDAEGRYILDGDPQARPAPHHSGGGNTAAAARYFLRIAERGPFRVAGDWFSSGVLVVALVAGPDAMTGSCIEPGATFRIHEARGGGHAGTPRTRYPGSARSHYRSTGNHIAVPLHTASTLSI